MKKYCIKCGKEIKNKKVKKPLDNELSTFNDASSDIVLKEDHCHNCNTSNDFDSLANMDSHEFNQLAHNNIIKATDKKDTALCFFVTGLVGLVIGGILFFLSFKRNVYNAREFRPTSLEFAMGVFLLALGGVALIYSVIKLVKSNKTKKYFKSLLRDVDYKD